MSIWRLCVIVRGMVRPSSFLPPPSLSLLLPPSHSYGLKYQVVRPRNRQFVQEPTVRPSDLYAPGTINPSCLPPPPSPSSPPNDQPANLHSPRANEGEAIPQEALPDDREWSLTLPASIFRTFVAVAAAGGAAQWFSQAWNAWGWWDGVGCQ